MNPSEITIIVNTAEDTEVSGLHVSPDLDTVTYTLAGIVNERTWYGIRNDTFWCHEMLKRLGCPELLRIGDRDRAVKLTRTLMMKRGVTLSKATRFIARRLGVKSRILPMTDDQVRTEIVTPRDKMSFHEFWVARRARVRVVGVKFRGIKKAEPAPGVVDAIRKSRAVIIGPSNPVTSIGPILHLRKIGRMLQTNRHKVLAVSPIIGRSPVSGPAGKLMRALGIEVSPFGVAKIYRNYISTLLIDTSDSGQADKIRSLGVQPVLAKLHMKTLKDKIVLARKVLSVAYRRAF